MKTFKSVQTIVGIFLILTAIFLLNSCNTSVNSPGEQTDNQYLADVISSGMNNSRGTVDNIMSNAIGDMDTVVAGNNGDNPFGSLIIWGRHITNVDVNLNITDYSDTVKSVLITRTITGNYIIVGVNMYGHDTTVFKPYTEVLRNLVSFKRIARTIHPRYNWRLYQISLLSGSTTSPQPLNKVVLNKIVVNDITSGVTYTFMGPDFTQNIFTIIRFGGIGLPVVNRGDNVTVTAYLNSTSNDTNIVAWHWARNTFGFHRIPFNFVSSVPSPNGGYDQVYQKNVTIYPQHLTGYYHVYINASTKESLFDDDNTKFNSSECGIPYKVQ